MVVLFIAFEPLLLPAASARIVLSKLVCPLDYSQFSSSWFSTLNDSWRLAPALRMPKAIVASSHRDSSMEATQSCHQFHYPHHHRLYCFKITTILRWLSRHPLRSMYRRRRQNRHLHFCHNSECISQPETSSYTVAFPTIVRDKNVSSTSSCTKQMESGNI